MQGMKHLSRRTPVRALVSAAMGLLVTLGLVAPAWACSCVEASVPEMIQRADVVARVRVTKIERSKEGDSAALAHYTMAPDRVWKGDIADQPFVVASASSGASCGLEGFVAGHELILFARADGAGWTADLCGGTATVESGREAEVVAALGAGRPVSAAPATGSPVTARPSPPAAAVPGSAAPAPSAAPWALLLPLVGIAALVAVAIGFVVTRWSRPRG